MLMKKAAQAALFNDADINLILIYQNKQLVMESYGLMHEKVEKDISAIFHFKVTIILIDHFRN